MRIVLRWFRTGGLSAGFLALNTIDSTLRCRCDMLIDSQTRTNFSLLAYTVIITSMADFCKDILKLTLIREGRELGLVCLSCLSVAVTVRYSLLRP